MAREFTPEEIQEASTRFSKKNGKQIVGQVRVQHKGQKGITKHILEDGSEFMEDDDKNPVAKWPKHPKRTKSERLAKLSRHDIVQSKPEDE